MADIGTAYVQIEPTAKGISGKINGEMESAGESASKSFGSGFGSVVGTIGNVAARAALTAKEAVGNIVSDAVSAYADFEQLEGGVDTLFSRSAEQTDALRQSMLDSGMTAQQVAQEMASIPDGADIVMENAANAYKTAGMSANEYMETVTSFSASLLQSLDGDTVKAAKSADMAISDMSDNANKMGSDISSIQNAYQGFAKQNYTMLDNLKLGYGGTKSEMERLLADASEFSGIKYDINSLDDVYNAIHVIQDQMGITGTTAKEASTTIQGSMASMGAAWQNVLTSMGTGEGLTENINALVESVGTVASNIMPVVQTALQGVSTLIVELAPQLGTMLLDLIQNTLPELLSSGVDIIRTLADGILAALPELVPVVLDLVMQIANLIVELAPTLIETGLNIIVQLALGIAQALPELVPTIIEVVLNIVQYLLDNIDLLLDAASQLMIGLAIGLVNAIPILIEKVPQIILSLFDAFVSAMTKLVETGRQIITIIADAVKTYAPQLMDKGRELMSDLKTKILEQVDKFMDIGKNIVDGIKKGISDAWSGFKEWLFGLLGGLVEGVQEFFKIGSPSKVFADDVGRWIPAGIAEGIDEGMSVLDDAMVGMTMSISPEQMSGVTAYSPTSQTMTGQGALGQVYSLLAQYLPVIASGENVSVSLDVDGAQLYRVMKREERRNTQLVGVTA